MVIRYLPLIFFFLVSLAFGESRNWTREVVGSDSRLYQKAIDAYEKQQNTHNQSESQSHIYCFISFSIPAASLKAMFESQDGKTDVTFVLTGFYQDSMEETQKKCVSLLQSDQDKNIFYEVSLIIDPTLFEEFGVEKVPHFIKLNDSGGKCASLLGDVLPDYFMEKITAKGEKDFGTYGNVYDIAENNVLDLLMARSEEVDWEYEIEEAYKRSLKNLPTFTFKQATENKTYLKTAEIVLQDDIRDSENNILVKKGEAVNPFNVMQYPYRDVIFDATDKRQWEIAKQIMEKSDKPVILSTTTLENLPELLEYFKQRVFLLDQRIVDRLEITELPIASEQYGKDFLITVYKVDK